MVNIGWTQIALDDLKEIYEYIEVDSKMYAERTIKSITNKVQRLVNDPKSGSFVPEIERENIRQLIVVRYRVIYKIVDSEAIEILTIHHSSRDLTKRNID
ncbi:MAG: hypothetical protein Kapaf2KO_08160 [Candidatus Kapaibacteriales bacterium]